MPAVKRKESIARSYKLRADLVRRMDEYKAEHGVSNTFTLERALELYLDDVAPVMKAKTKSERRR